MSPATLAALSGYLPVVGYLIVVCALLWATAKVPTWVHPLFLGAGLVARVLHAGWAEAVLSGGVAAVGFVLLVFLVGATMSGVSLFTLVVTVALTPVTGWPGLLAGLLIAAGTALVRTWRNLGKDRVALLTLDTLSAMGVSPAGTLKVPELGLIPQRDQLVDVHADTEEAGKVRMYLPPYLLLGVGVALGLACLSR